MFRIQVDPALMANVPCLFCPRPFIHTQVHFQDTLSFGKSLVKCYWVYDRII